MIGRILDRDTARPLDARLFLLLRLALASAFLFSGVQKALDFGGATAEARALAGIEPAWLVAVAVIATQLGGSVLLLLGGRATQIGAALLGAFTLVATVVAHDFWTKAGVAQIRDATTFFEHAGLIAGFVLAALAARHTR